MADPDLQIRGWGGGGYLDLEIKTGIGPGLKNVFSVLWVSVWSKNKAGGGEGAGSPGTATAIGFYL